MKAPRCIATNALGLALAGCLTATTVFNCTAFAQQRDSSSAGTPGELPAPSSVAELLNEETFEGRLVPLFELLNSGSRPSSPDPQPPAPRATATRSDGSAEPAGPIRHPEAAPHAAAGPAQVESEPGPEMKEYAPTMDTQPLALLVSADPSSSSRPASDAAGSKQAYVLVFDPKDPKSQIAYQVAQAMAETNRLLDEEIKAREKESEPVPDTADPARIERVRVTGRIMQHMGLEAIAVVHVERAQSLQKVAPLLEPK